MDKEKRLDKNSDEFGTPQDIFDELHEEFQFDYDACATSENAKLRSFGRKETNSLKINWFGLRVFCNPPYSRGNVKLFAEKAFEETSKNRKCMLAVLLIPTYTEREWFHRMKNSGRVDVRFFKKRIKFIGGETSARGNHMLMIFRRESDLW